MKWKDILQAPIEFSLRICKYNNQNIGNNISKYWRVLRDISYLYYDIFYILV